MHGVAAIYIALDEAPKEVVSFSDLNFEQKRCTVVEAVDHALALKWDRLLRNSRISSTPLKVTRCRLAGDTRALFPAVLCSTAVGTAGLNFRLCRCVFGFNIGILFFFNSKFSGWLFRISRNTEFKIQNYKFEI